MKLELKRWQTNAKQTIGKLTLFQHNRPIASWDSLELPWLQNQRNISCIPKGKYTAIKHVSPKFGNCFWLQNVLQRSEILIHKGNFYTDIRGCILIGKGLKDINNDGQLDVVRSTIAVKELLDLTSSLDIIQIIIK